MKQTFLVLLFSTFCWLSSEAQCKFKPIPSKLKRYCNASNKPSPDTHTKMRVFFDKLYFVGQASFAKQGDQYFFYLHLARQYSSAFELKKPNTIVFTMESGKTIEAFPVSDFSGKRMLTWFAVGCYYGLSKEQLLTLSSEKVKQFRIYVNSETNINTSNERDGSGWQKDDKGNVFFNHTIGDEWKKENIKEAANCLLTKL